MTHTKTLIAVLAATFAGYASAQENVVLAKVLSAVPIETMRASAEVGPPVCTVTYVQVPRTVAVPVYRDQAVPLLGMLVGAAIGGHAFKGDSRAAGTLLGAAVAYNAVNTPQPQVQYQTQYEMQPRETCQTFYETVYRPVITGYQVTYTFNGRTNVVMMKTHPGEYVKVITSYRIEP